MRLTRSRKALSPVVASIILIAVTVAVSIAVAAWMGALSFNFMNTEQITFTNYQWDTSGTPGWFSFTVKNTGSTDLSIQEVRIDGAPYTWVAPNATISWPLFTAKGNTQTFYMNRTYAHGISYEFTVITSKGTTFGPFVKSAP